MKTIQTKAIITSIRAKVDGSLGFSGVTPEYTIEEKVAFMELQNQNLTMTIEPSEYPNAPKIVVDKEVNEKSDSQRLYGVLYVWWEQQGRPDGDFTIFRHKQMEKIISAVKDKLE